MLKNNSIFVAGHAGLVGSAVCRQLEAAGFTNIVKRPRQELDLGDQAKTLEFFLRERPSAVVLAAAKVGGIRANAEYPAEFIRDNLAIQTSVIDAAYRAGVKRLLFLGSSCIYPKFAGQPIKEEYLLTGELEPTNEAYAIAKIAGMKMCQYYRSQWGFEALSLMPSNLYGPGDNFDLETSHVMGALIKKFHEGKTSNASEVEVWGTGTPKREFLYVDDLAGACRLLLDAPAEELFRVAPDGVFNVGSGTDLTIAELAETVAGIVGYTGSIVFDTSKPDGTPRKLLDVSRMGEIGWHARTPLADGIRMTYQWYLGQKQSGKTALDRRAAV